MKILVVIYTFAFIYDNDHSLKVSGSQVVYCSNADFVSYQKMSMHLTAISGREYAKTQ